MSGSKAQYTIRGVLPEVDQTLRKIAKSKHMSLNRYLLEQLQEVADRERNPSPNNDLDFAIGSMTDGPLVDEGIKPFSIIDENAWK